MALSSTKIFVLESRPVWGMEMVIYLYLPPPHPPQRISKIMKDANIVFVRAMCKAWFQEPGSCWHLDTPVIWKALDCSSLFSGSKRCLSG